MAIAGAQTATVLNDAILTETIALAMRFATDSANLFPDFVELPPTLANTKRWAVNIYSLLAASSPYTETDTVVAQATTPTAVNVDTTLWATGAFLGDWGDKLAVHSQIPGLTQALIDSMNLRFETDSLALASSMTNSSGSSTTTNTVDNFVQVTSAFRTTGKRSTLRPWMVLSESARRDLHADVMANGGSIYASVVGTDLVNAVGKANQGEWTEWGGYMIASTDRVPTIANGKGNFIVHRAPNEFALGLAFSLEPRIEPARRPENLGTYLIASHAHAAGVIEQARARRFITKN